MGIELTDKTMTLLEAYDRGVLRVGKVALVSGTHCAVTPTGKCVGCAMGAVFLGAHPDVPCPTGPEQAYELDELVGSWRTAHWKADLTPENQDLVATFTRIEQFNDMEAPRLKGDQPIWEDEDMPAHDPDGRDYRKRVSVDKVRKFIIREGYGDLLVRVADPKSLPKAVLV